MAFTISSKNGEKTFSDRDLVNISSKPGYDYQIDTPFPFMLTVHYDKNTGKCLLINQYRSQKFLFKGKPISTSLDVEKVCKLMIDGTDEFLMIKCDGQAHQSLAGNAMTEDDIRAVYGNEVNAGAKLKLEQRKSELETARVAICKQISAPINDMRHRISMNSKGGILLHIALFLASLVCAFGVSNYLTGLPLTDAGSVIQMPTNMKLIFVYAFVIFGIGLVLKQGVYLLLQEKEGQTLENSGIAQRFMIVLSSAFYIAVYLINVLYYLGPKSLPFFAVFISLFFVGTALTLAIACGYFKSVNVTTKLELNKYEYREDFEQVMREYQKWIEWFANNLSKTKLNNIKDRLFTLQLHSWGEIIAGLITAPALAYGVSNTLAMCFPEAAGWVRISGLRLSPVFLLLATCLIVAAFFCFSAAFTESKKIQGSNVLKQDGFSNYATHGVDLYGLEAEKKLDANMRRFLLIGLAIIGIEITMNISYFMQSIGGDLKGMLLSAVAALVPTALLIAETFMLSQTNYEKFASEELLAKIDRD